MILFFYTLVQAAANILSLLVIASVILSYFMAPFHPIRRYIDMVVEPMLIPIRKVLPRMGMFDFSAFALILIIQVVEMLLLTLIGSLR
ncbi:MAG: YggT family protein [Chloroflexi bacterium HGW-Chloroflexi-10]|nr:MAG: YggT family protein [Chloroflexi bacterium HGW-Chloroflexi-10]